MIQHFFIYKILKNAHPRFIMTKNQKTTTTKIPVMYVSLLGILLFTFHTQVSIAQAQTVSLVQLTDSSLAQAIKTYDISIRRNSFLYTGRVYNNKYSSIEGHPFFMDEYWEEGIICYKGQQFDSVNLMYEIFNDEVLVESFTSKGALAPIKLHAADVASFIVFGHTFVRLESDSSQSIRAGFYDVLFDGNTVQLYSRRSKEVVKSNDVNTVAESFIQKDRYYIFKDGQYYQVKKKGALFKVLEDHKKELKRFAKANMLSFSVDRERSLIEVARYYESLK
jgi:hypothetical protein